MTTVVRYIVIWGKPLIVSLIGKRIIKLTVLVLPGRK